MQYRLYYHRKLPHYQPKHGVFFITLRLAFSLPEKYLQALNRYKDTLRKSYAELETQKPDNNAIRKKVFAYEDELYNHCATKVDISSAPTATLITDKLLSMQQEMFYLYAFTIMPNHLHMLIRPLEREGEQIAISETIKSFKGHTARMVNQALNRQGQLWFREYHDHWIRNQQ